jgi:hypothetical protein
MSNDLIPIKILEITGDSSLLLKQVEEGQNCHILLTLIKFQLPKGFIEQALALFARDPMIAFINPKIITYEDNDNKDPNAQQIYHIYPIEFEYIPIASTICVLIRNTIVSDFLFEFHRTFEKSLSSSQYLIFSAFCNKYGYRSVVCNTFPLIVRQSELLCKDFINNTSTVLKRFPEIQWGLTDYSDSFESNFSKLFALVNSQSWTDILIDIRDMPLKLNGTSIIIIEFLKAISEDSNHKDQKIRFTILLKSSQINFLLEQNVKIKNFDFITGVKNRFFCIALKLGQPWTFNTIRELSECALYNYYYFYDTIASDCYYLRKSDQHLNELWHFISEYANGIFFISQFSYQQFVNRYGDFCFKKTVLLPLNLSTTKVPVETVNRNNGSEYVLIFGNHLHHKAVQETAVFLGQNRLQIEGLNKIILVGVSYHDPQLNIIGYESGKLSMNALRELYLNAICVIFPSHYEGFGLPIVEAMTFNKDIFVRNLPVYTEIELAYSNANKKLNIFSDNMELIQKLKEFFRKKNQVEALQTITQKSAYPSEAVESYTWKNTLNIILIEMLNITSKSDLNQTIKRQKHLDYQKKFWIQSQDILNISLIKILNKKLRTLTKRIFNLD